jgi:hypothetical protein
MSVGSLNIITDGLVFHVDAANSKSYPGHLFSGVPCLDDLSSNMNDVSLVNGPTFSSTNGGILSFDGVNDYGVLLNNIDFSNYSNGFTITVWIKIDNSLSQSNKYLFSKLTSSSTDNQFSIAYGYVSQTFELYSGDQNIRTGSQISIIDLGWHQLTYTVGSTTIGYKDGVSMFNNSYGSLAFTPSTSNSYISSFDGTGNFLQGSIGSISIYNRILTQSEVLNNYNKLKWRFL